MFYRSRSSSTSSNMSSTSSSPAFQGIGWMPAQAAVSPAATSIAAMDYFTCKHTTSAAASLRRDSTSSTTSSNAPSITFDVASPLSPSIAYPSWSETSSRNAEAKANAGHQLPPTYIATSHISNDDLEALDFTPASRRVSPAMDAVCMPEFDAGAAGISWSATRQPGVPQHEERRRRLPPPPPGMMTTCGRSSSKRKSSKERRQKALSMIKE